MSWFYTCFCGAEQGEGGGTCSSQAGGRQCGRALQGRSWQLGVRVLADQGAGHQGPGVWGAGSWQLRVQVCPSGLSISTAGRQDLTGDPCTTLQGKGILVQDEYREEEGEKEWG